MVQRNKENEKNSFTNLNIVDFFPSISNEMPLTLLAQPQLLTKIYLTLS